MNCRHCGWDVSLTLVDLGSAPPSNAFLTPQSLRMSEKWFPLRVLVCENCWLAQTEDFSRAYELFDAEYAYFSSYSSSWLEHCERYVMTMIERFALNQDSHVVEVAANDGYLLQFVKRQGIPCLGIEPTANTAIVARQKGIPIVEEFFSSNLAKKLSANSKQADLIAAKNVLAHVPNINDFVSGFALLLKPQGVATFEFPHLLRLISEKQFDTIYQEHFSYLSLTAVERIFQSNGLTVFDVEEHPTHGGSLRVFAQRTNTGTYRRHEHVVELLQCEMNAGMATPDYYVGFQAIVDGVKNDFNAFLLEAKSQNKTVVGYGAAAKGNTLLNYSGVRSDLISFLVDRNPSKQGKFMPGNRIPIYEEQALREAKPDYVVIFPWNLRSEIMQQLSYVREWGGHFVTAIPVLEVH